MDETDELAALYGDIEDAKNKEPDASSKLTGTTDGPTSALNTAEEDDALFAQLYGEQPPPSEPAPKVFDPYEASKVEIEGRMPEATTASAHPGPESHQAPGALEPEEEDEDDLMITLDENATAYEPTTQSQPQFRKPSIPGVQFNESIGAAPGQHMDDQSGQSGIPGLGSGGFGTRTAIGGIPRSAIPGLSVSFATSIPAASPETTAPGPPASGTAAGQASGGTRPPLPGAPTRPLVLRMEDAVFPSQWRSGLPIKLPGQTKVSPEEYREFLSLGHGDIFDIEIDHVVDPPWRYPGIDPSDFFNYGMNENTWKQYIAEVKRYRLEFTMKGQIQTLDLGQGAAQLGGAPIGGHGYGGGGIGTVWAGEGDGEQSLQRTAQEFKDEQYDAFVTSERPARVQWPRYGSPWDHTLILTGHDIAFEGPEPDGPSSAAEAPIPVMGGSQASVKPKPHAPHPPVHMQHHHVQMSTPQMHNMQMQGPGPPLGLMLPPPFMAPGGFGGVSSLPPPFMMGGDALGEGQYYPGMQMQMQMQGASTGAGTGAGGQGLGGFPGDQMGMGGFQHPPSGALAVGMDIDMDRRPPPGNGPGPRPYGGKPRYGGGGPPLQRGPRPPPYRDFGGPPRPPYNRDFGPPGGGAGYFRPPPFRERGPPPGWGGGPGNLVYREGRRRDRSRSPVRDQRRSTSPKRRRDRSRSPRDRGPREKDRRRSSRSRSPRSSKGARSKK